LQLPQCILAAPFVVGHALNTHARDTEPSTDPTCPVDKTDWLKTAAIIMVVVNHFSYFFVGEFDWINVFTPWAATVFFFLLGYAHTRTVPFSWIWLGVLLTVLDGWNNDWEWMGPSILLSFALIRWTRPYVGALAQRYGWTAFVIIVSVLVAVTPIAEYVVEYGSTGWLWALAGMYQRMYLDTRSTMASGSTGQGEVIERAGTPGAGIMRFLVCLIAAAAFVYQERILYEFDDIQTTFFALTVGIASLVLLRFRRGPSGIQPPELMASALRFCGRYTFEIYSIQLVGSEFFVLLFPELAV
jgi:hypothetical protein